MAFSSVVASLCRKNVRKGKKERAPGNRWEREKEKERRLPPFLSFPRQPGLLLINYCYLMNHDWKTSCGLINSRTYHAAPPQMGLK